VASDPFGSAVDNDVGTMVDGSAEEATGTESVIHHQWYASLVCYFRNCCKIRHVVSGIADALHVHHLCLLIDSLLELFRAVSLHEFGCNAKAGQSYLELVVSAAVKVAGADNVVSCMRKSRDGHKLGSLARRSSKSSHTTFQSCDALLEDIDRWVHDATVDIAKLFEAKEPSSMG
jgi:hypothetical protein